VTGARKLPMLWMLVEMRSFHDDFRSQRNLSGMYLFVVQLLSKPVSGKRSCLHLRSRMNLATCMRLSC
jgi:hypothetical protein